MYSSWGWALQELGPCSAPPHGALILIKPTPLVLTYGDHRSICRELETDKGNGESMEVIQGLDFSV
jgi:hypothetical protein